MRYIYILKDPISKAVVYVGETSNPKQRYNAHCWGNSFDSEEKTVWNNRLKSIGLKPLFEIVDTANDKSEAIIKEKDLIISYLNKGCDLFNLRNTATVKQYDLNGNLIAEYSHTVIAEKLTGITPRIDRGIAGGYFWSFGDFNKSIVYKSLNGRKGLCKQVFQYDKKGELKGVFRGVREAGSYTGIDHKSISQVAAGSKIRKTAGGFIWKYKEQAA